MEIPKIRVSIQVAILAALVAAGIALRLLPHMPNFAPVAAISLLAGALFGWRIAAWVPVAIMAGSDMILGFYPGFYFTWIGFVLVALLGVLVRRQCFTSRVTLGAIGSGAIFFLVSNFGVWLTSGMYAMTFAGLAQCYVMGLPFLRTSFTADLVYAIALFGAYEAAFYFVRLRGAQQQRVVVASESV